MSHQTTSRLAVWIITLFTACLSLHANAHEVPPSTMLLDIGANSIHVELHLPLSELGSALSRPLTEHPEQVVAQHAAMLRNYLLEHLHVSTPAADKVPALPYAIALQSLSLTKTSNSNWTSNDWLVAQFQVTAPAGHSAEKFAIDYDGIVHQVVTHNTFVSVRHDFRNAILGEKPKLLGLIGFQQTHLQVDGSHGSWWQGFAAVFAMGTRHIAEGTDHVLFLLVLLLPAPLIARSGRWQQPDGIKRSVLRIVKTVSGFTIGHSITLALAAIGMIQVPSQPIEVLIAVSIIVSAAHAWQPLFAGKESWIATGFGLIHGLAFASALSGFNYDKWTLASSLLSFNLGIEAMQLLVIAALLPWLILMSRNQAYQWLRYLSATSATLAAVGWIGERAFALSNPVQPAINYLTAHALPGLAILTGLVLLLEAQRRWPLRRSEATFD